MYSSQTFQDGEIAKINSYDFDSKCLTWTTDGIYAGTLFLRNGKFSMTTHCGALILKEKYREDISLEYVYALFSTGVLATVLFGANPITNPVTIIAIERTITAIAGPYCFI